MNPTSSMCASSITASPLPREQVRFPRGSVSQLSTYGETIPWRTSRTSSSNPATPNASDNFCSFCSRFTRAPFDPV